MITILPIFSIQPYYFYYWVYSTKSFWHNFEDINATIVECSFILKVLGHYYPQNIWHFEFMENYDF